MTQNGRRLLVLLATCFVACGDDPTDANPALGVDAGEVDSSEESTKDAGASMSMESGSSSDATQDAAVAILEAADVSELAGIPLMDMTTAQARTLCEFRRAEQHRAYAREESVCAQFGAAVGNTFVTSTTESPSAHCSEVADACAAMHGFANLVAKIDAVDCSSFTLADLNVSDTWHCDATIGDLTACWTESADRLQANAAQVTCDDPATYELPAKSLHCREWENGCYGLNYWDVRVPR
jgi:hypothetical protein